MLLIVDLFCFVISLGVGIYYLRDMIIKKQMDCLILFGVFWICLILLQLYNMLPRIEYVIGI